MNLNICDSLYYYKKSKALNIEANVNTSSLIFRILNCNWKTPILQGGPTVRYAIMQAQF